MSLADDFQAALERARLAHQEILSRFEGNPPPELAEHFQKVQDSAAGGTSWVRELSDRMDQSRAKVKAKLDAEAQGERPSDEGIDFDAYPWQFKDEHGLPPDKARQLLADLGIKVDPPPQAPAVASLPAAKPSLPRPKAPPAAPAPPLRKRRDQASEAEQDGDTLDIRDYDV